MGGPAKHSRKGKKAWRKNIDVADVDEFLQQETHQARRGPELKSLQDADLFFTDRAPGTEAAPTSTQRKRARQTKPLRSQAIIDAHKAVTPVVTARGAPRKLQRASAPAPAPAAPAAGRQPQKRKRAGGLSVKADMWEAEADMAGAAAAPEGAGDGAQPSTSGRHDPVSAPHEWRAQRLPAGKPSLAKRQRAQAASAARSIQPVEVDMGGCSFNPEYEQHQDALAEVVAAELKKQIRMEMQPTAPPKHVVDLPALAAAQDDGSDDDDEAPAAAQQLPVPDANAIPLDADSDEEGGEAGQQLAPSAAAAAAAKRQAPGSSGKKALDKKTRSDRNRDARRREQEREVAAKRALKDQRRQLEQLASLQEALEAEEEGRALKRQRRQVVRAEKATQQPPRLGKQRYEPTAAPVMTSDEITGSLREVKPCFTVAKDRFKSLQKRGLIEPRRPAHHRKGRRVQYVGGERTEKALEGQEEVQQMQQARMALQKQAKKASKVAAKAAAGGGQGVLALGSGAGFTGSDLWA